MTPSNSAHKIHPSLFGLIFFLLLVTGCSSETMPDIPAHIAELDNLTIFSLESESVPEIKLIQELRFGGTDDAVIGAIEYKPVFDQDRIVDRVAADDSGRVFIGDIQQNIIHVFQPDGTRLTSLGRQGSGPGEFQVISEVKIISDHLYIVDPIEGKLHVFSLKSLALSHTRSIIPENHNNIEELTGLYPDYYYIRNDESVLTGFKTLPFELEGTEIQDPLLFYIMDDNGTLRPEKILEQKDIKIYRGTGNEQHHMYSFDFNPVDLRVLSQEDYIYTIWTEDFLIKVHSPDGEYLRSFYFPFEKKEMSRSDLVNKEPRGEPYRNILRKADLPEYWPVIRSALIDDNDRLWISTFSDNKDLDEWWVVNENGELYGRFSFPRDRWIREIRNNMVYTVETDAETDEYKVVRYRIEI